MVGNDVAFEIFFDFLINDERNVCGATKRRERTVGTLPLWMNKIKKQNILFFHNKNFMY